MFQRFKSLLSILLVYITVTGIVTFALFIHEEAIQTAMFGTWPAKDAKQWHIVLSGLELMSGINLSMKIINYSLGWINPLALLSYRNYSKAADFYIKSVKTEAFAHEPELFIGKEIDFMFYPKKIVRLNDGRYLLTNGKIGVISIDMPKIQKTHIKGVVVECDQYLVIKNDSK